MILHPGILALTTGSVLMSFLTLYATAYGVKIWRFWDLQSGSERQLGLEQTTYLVATVMSYVFAYELGSLFLFIFTADKLSPLFVGAMCAAGTLNANGWGYLALGCKLINFVLGGIWLIVNHVDNQALDYPLIRTKYLSLFAIAPFILAESVLQAAYFLNLDAHVITSCCGSLFGSEGKGLAAAFSALPSVPAKITFYASIGLTGIAGCAFLRTGKPGVGLAFSGLSLVSFGVALAALISVFSLYFYELPTHHCPFCLLQREYGYVGFFLYAFLLGGVVNGVAVGVLVPARALPSLRALLPPFQRRLTLVALSSFLAFLAVVTLRMALSGFRLEGY